MGNRAARKERRKTRKARRKTRRKNRDERRETRKQTREARRDKREARKQGRLDKRLSKSAGKAGIDEEYYTSDAYKDGKEAWFDKLDEEEAAFAEEEARQDAAQNYDMFTNGNAFTNELPQFDPTEFNVNTGGTGIDWF